MVNINKAVSKRTADKQRLIIWMEDNDVSICNLDYRLLSEYTQQEKISVIHGIVDFNAIREDQYSKQLTDQYIKWLKEINGAHTEQLLIIFCKDADPSNVKAQWMHRLFIEIGLGN